ncbi:MAG: hypothetical protein M3397_12825 [Actinomycetota bacterium]|nr:hypothetical protein [Rubrobacter sp.]MBA3790702.1 hypothetical protein [Rubrobacter sp.]MDQ3238228.1 hypothetical protein [Actinomycetota bacterium]MDQ3568948.1 hypothetical protein [Actinomycetota bacterium]
MSRVTCLLTTGMLTLVLLACAASTAGAEPEKNQITVPGAQCDNGEEITFVIEGMGKGAKLPEGDGNLVIKDYTLIYTDPDTKEVLETIEYGGGQKTGQADDLVTCLGETTTEIVGFGLVTIDFRLQGFFTPRD